MRAKVTCSGILLVFSRKRMADMKVSAYFTQAGPAFHLKPGRHFTNGRAGGGVVHDRVDCE